MMPAGHWTWPRRPFYARPRRLDGGRWSRMALADHGGRVGRALVRSFRSFLERRCVVVPGDC